MKKTLKLFLCFLAVLLLLVAGCGESGGRDDDDNGGEKKDLSDFTQWKDWSIALDHENTYAGELKVEPFMEGSNGVLKVTWGVNVDYKMCMLSAVLPAGKNYGGFDGISFKIKTGVGEAEMVPRFLINGVAGTFQDGTNLTIDSGEWKTMTKPFSEFAWFDWGGTPSSTNLKAVLDVGDKYLLNPILSGILQGTHKNTPVTYLFDDIGFYSGSTANTTIIWDFND
jgi:hypothetical protein